MHHSLLSRIVRIFLVDKIFTMNAKLSTRPIAWCVRNWCRWFLAIILHVFDCMYFAWIFCFLFLQFFHTEDQHIVTLLGREGNGEGNGYAEAAILNRQFARQLTPPRHAFENAVSRNLYRRHRERSRSRDRGPWRWPRAQIANERVEKIALHAESSISDLACFSVFKACFLHVILFFFRARCDATFLRKSFWFCMFAFGFACSPLTLLRFGSIFAIMSESFRHLLRLSWEFLGDVKRNAVATKLHCIRMDFWMHPLDMFFSSLHFFLLQKQCLGAACWRKCGHGILGTRASAGFGPSAAQCWSDGRLYMLLCFNGIFYILLWGWSFGVGLLYI